MLSGLAGYIRQHHLGLIAIFIALSGTAYAVTLPRGSVTSKHVKNRSLLEKDLKRGVLPEETPRLFAAVTEDGAVSNSSGQVLTSKAGRGIYLVRFPQSVSGCAAVATQGTVPLQGSPGGQADSVHGAVGVGLASPGNDYANGFPSGKTIVINTYEGNALADSSFHLVVAC
jgi:hypothetical protein